MPAIKLTKKEAEKIGLWNPPVKKSKEKAKKTKTNGFGIFATKSDRQRKKKRLVRNIWNHII